MGRSSIGNAEFERLVSRTGNRSFLGRPYTGRKEDMTCAECVYAAGVNDRANGMASGTVSGRSPLIVPMAFARAVSELYARGRKPVSFGLLLAAPKDAPEDALREFMKAYYRLAELNDAEIIREERTDYTVRITAYGEPYEGFSEPEAATGDIAVVMCGQAGAEETVLLAEEHGKLLHKKLPSHFLAEIPELLQPETAETVCRIGFENGALYQCACGDGGVYAGLYRMGERIRTGMKINLPEIPISQLTIEVCEILDIDPYQIGSGGCVLMAAADGERLADALTAAGFEAAVIGSLWEGKAKELHNGGEVRYLEPYRGIHF